MKPFAALLALGLVCGAAAANLTCVKTPAEFVANLETIDYQQLDRPWFCAFAVFEYALVNMLFRIEARVEKARDKAEAECGIKSIEHKRAAKEAIKAKIKSPTDSLRKRTQETKIEEAVEVPEVSDEAQAKILREVRIAAGRLGRLTLWGADMWIKDQYVDIFCRWVYLPLYAILAAISLNEST